MAARAERIKNGRDRDVIKVVKFLGDEIVFRRSKVPFVMTGCTV